MYSVELQKQKALFAVVDEVALLLAFAVALVLHDPSRAMATRLHNASPGLLYMGVVVVAFLWVLVFRAFDLYRLRNGGMDETVAIIKATTVASLLTLILAFFAHIDVSRLTVGIAYPLSIV